MSKKEVSNFIGHMICGLMVVIPIGYLIIFAIKSESKVAIPMLLLGLLGILIEVLGVHSESGDPHGRHN